MKHVVTKRVGKGQRWGTIGMGRFCHVTGVVSYDKRELIKHRAKGLGIGVSAYINVLLARDIGPGYDAS